MVRRASRDGVGLAPGGPDRIERPGPAVADPDVEPGVVEPNIAAHDPGQLNVADSVIDDVGPVDPMFLDGHGLETQVAGDTGHLPSVVRLHAADRHEGVAALRERLGNQVLELADLVPAEGDS